MRGMNSYTQLMSFQNTIVSLILRLLIELTFEPLFLLMPHLESDIFLLS